MVEHRILTDEELEEHDRRYDCTGVAARWCPIHGDCECDHSEGDEYPGVDEDGTPCPLHSPTSTHADQ